MMTRSCVEAGVLHGPLLAASDAAAACRSAPTGFSIGTLTSSAATLAFFSAASFSAFSISRLFGMATWCHAAAI